MRLKLTAAFAVALLSTTAVIYAQVAAGTINVEVQDSSGALIPGGIITLTHVGSGQVRTGVTSASGTFRAAFMPVGEYSIRVEAPGFKSKTTTGLVLQVDQNAAITLVLEPGEVRESVQVTVASPLLETNTSSIGQVVENKKIVDLRTRRRRLHAFRGRRPGIQGPDQQFFGGIRLLGGHDHERDDEVRLERASRRLVRVPAE